MKPGLSPTEWQQLREEEHSYLEEAVTTVTPYTGISSNALAHLRDEWISWKDDFILIDIPPEDSCNDYKMSSGGGLSNEPPMYDHRVEPCIRCKNEGKTDGFENLEPSGYTRTKVDQVILHREIASPAVEFIETVFQVYNRPELGVIPDSVHEAANRVLNGEKSEHDYCKLKRTAPVIYAHYGLSCDDISQLTTYRPSTIKQIVQTTPGVNFDNISTVEFLRVISNKEPVTVSELSNELGYYRSPTHTRLTNLKKEGRVTVSNNNPGRPAATWTTTSQWNKPFRCSECDFTTYSLGGIRTHRGQIHEQN